MKKALVLVPTAMILNIQNGSMIPTTKAFVISDIPLSMCISYRRTTTIHFPSSALDDNTIHVSSSSWTPLLFPRSMTTRLLSHMSSADMSSFNNNEDDDNNNNHPMTMTSFLSHMMLKVPSVDTTAQYWISKGGTIRASSTLKKDTPTTPGHEGSTPVNGGNLQYSNDNNDDKLQSAFVELGVYSAGRKNQNQNNDRSKEKEESPICFALELVRTTPNNKQYTIGNALSYIGVSMLLQLQNKMNQKGMLGLMFDEEDNRPVNDPNIKNEPNGIVVQSSAAAPGDFFARIVFRSTNLSVTSDFYTTVLGMSIKAQDDDLLCLRYEYDSGTGVPTTLVFENYKSDDGIVIGDCFDHFVIATKTSIEELHTRFTDESDTASSTSKIFMKPTTMFGRQVMGFLDPNGYKVIIASIP